MLKYHNHLYNSYLNEISDNFIRKVTGIDYGGKYYDSFNNTNDVFHRRRNDRISGLLFRNMANQLDRENRKDGGYIGGNITFNQKDPYNMSDNSKRKFGIVTVNGVNGIRGEGLRLSGNKEKYQKFMNNLDNVNKINTMRNRILANQEKKAIAASGRNSKGFFRNLFTIRKNTSTSK